MLGVWELGTLNLLLYKFEIACTTQLHDLSLIYLSYFQITDTTSTTSQTQDDLALTKNNPCMRQQPISRRNPGQKSSTTNPRSNNTTRYSVGDFSLLTSQFAAATIGLYHHAHSYSDGSGGGGTHFQTLKLNALIA